MPVAKVIELSSTSERSFEDAINQGIARATATLHGVTSAWVKEQRIAIRDNRISEYQVNLLITFVLDGAGQGEGGAEAGGAPGGGGSRGPRGRR